MTIEQEENAKMKLCGICKNYTQEDYKTEIENLKIQLEEKKQQNKYLLTELKMLNNVIVDYQLQNAELKAKIKRLESLEYQSV